LKESSLLFIINQNKFYFANNSNSITKNNKYAYRNSSLKVAEVFEERDLKDAAVLVAVLIIVCCAVASSFIADP
jgi:hypothetical protein